MAMGMALIAIVVVVFAFGLFIADEMRRNS
jgi:hypothetical protein